MATKAELAEKFAPKVAALKERLVTLDVKAKRIVAKREGVEKALAEIQKAIEEAK